MHGTLIEKTKLIKSSSEISLSLAKKGAVYDA